MDNMDLNSKISLRIKTAIKAKLTDYGVYVDDELPKYIMIMIANKKSKQRMKKDLELFLQQHTDKFVNWLQKLLEQLQAIANDSKRQTSVSGHSGPQVQVISGVKSSSTKGSEEIRADTTTSNKSKDSDKVNIKSDSEVSIHIEGSQDFVLKNDIPPSHCKTKSHKITEKEKQHFPSSSAPQSLPLKSETVVIGSSRKMGNYSKDKLKNEDATDLSASKETDTIKEDRSSFIKAEPTLLKSEVDLSEAHISIPESSSASHANTSSVVSVSDFEGSTVFLERLHHHFPDGIKTEVSGAVTRDSEVVGSSFVKSEEKNYLSEKEKRKRRKKKKEKHSTKKHRKDHSDKPIASLVHRMAPSSIGNDSHIASQHSSVKSTLSDSKHSTIKDVRESFISLPCERMEAEKVLPRVGFTKNNSSVEMSNDDDVVQVELDECDLDPLQDDPALGLVSSASTIPRLSNLECVPRTADSRFVSYAGSNVNVGKEEVATYKAEDRMIDMRRVVPSVVVSQPAQMVADDDDDDVPDRTVQSRVSLAPRSRSRTATHMTHPSLLLRAITQATKSVVPKCTSELQLVKDTTENAVQNATRVEVDGHTVEKPMDLREMLRRRREERLFSGNPPRNVVVSSRKRTAEDVFDSQKILKVEKQLPATSTSDSSSTFAPRSLQRPLASRLGPKDSESTLSRICTTSRSTRSPSPLFVVTLGGCKPLGDMAVSNVQFQGKEYYGCSQFEMETQHDEGHHPSMLSVVSAASLSTPPPIPSPAHIETPVMSEISINLNEDTDDELPMEMMEEDGATPMDASEVTESLNLKHSDLTERCRFWPNCRNNDSCPYVHPSSPCTKFPNCSYGEKCIFLHPECKFGDRCTRVECPYAHQMTRKFLEAPDAVLGGSINSVCKFHPNCLNSSCLFLHPSQSYPKFSKNRRAHGTFAIAADPRKYHWKANSTSALPTTVS